MATQPVSDAATSMRVCVDSIAAGGDGVARANGLVVFLPRTAPGDCGQARVTVRARLARGMLETLDTASDVRVTPPCAHYTRDRCGGCQLQHMTYPAQLAAKSGIVRDAIQRIGRREVALPDVVPSEQQWRYRRKLTLALRRKGTRWIAGLHPFDASRHVFDLQDCPITDERVVAVWREIMLADALLPDVAALRGAVRLLGNGAGFVLEGARHWPFERHSAFFAQVPSLAALWWEREPGTRVLLHEREAGVAHGASFAQVNVAMSEVLHAHVAERALAHAPRHAVDAYAGTGDTAVRLACAGVQVVAIECDADASAHSATRLPENSLAVAARVEDALSRYLPTDVIIVNPPRSGLDAQVTHTLATAIPPRALVYVSCNPATLARDLARLPGYRVAALRAFDMFPQTAHVETVCELVPEAA